MINARRVFAAQRRAFAAGLDVHPTHAALHVPMHLNRHVRMTAVGAAPKGVHLFEYSGVCA